MTDTPLSTKGWENLKKREQGGEVSNDDYLRGYQRGYSDGLKDRERFHFDQQTTPEHYVVANGERHDVPQETDGNDDPGVAAVQQP